MASERQARLVLRPECDEWKLIEEHAELFDGVILRESHLAPYPVGHSLQEHPERLLGAVHGRGLGLWRDPETAGLCSRSVQRLPEKSRLIKTPYALAFELPLDLAVFAQDAPRRHLLEIASTTQAGNEASVAPYFDVGKRDSPAARLNLRLSRELSRSVAEEVPTAWLQMTRHRFLSGLAVALAGDYAAAGVRRVVLRVRGLQSQRAGAQELLAYLDAIDAFEGRGIEAFGDCAGMLGPVLVAGGATGFSTGTRFFRSVGAGLVATPGGGGGAPVAVQPAGGWSEVPRPAAQEVHATRVSNMQTLRDLTDLAVRDPDALVASLLRDGGAYPAVWASVLAGRKRRAV